MAGTAGRTGTDEKTSTVRAVNRAIDVLFSFDGAGGPLTVAEIARKTGLNRATVYRLLDTLAETDMIATVGEPPRFRLGHGAMRLGRIWAAQIDIGVLARPVLDGLRDETGESASLFLLRDDRQICVLESPSRQPLSMSRGIGEMEPGFRGASGKVILAWLDEAHAASLVDKGGGDKGGQDGRRAVIGKDLAKIRRDGYAVSHGEVFIGALAISVPVFDGNGEIMGSLSLYGPKARMRSDLLPGFVKKVVAGGARLSAALGFQGPR
jgi:DNA-binding IclR family transcriptional regulator